MMGRTTFCNREGGLSRRQRRRSITAGCHVRSWWAGRRALPRTDDVPNPSVPRGGAAEKAAPLRDDAGQL